MGRTINSATKSNGFLAGQWHDASGRREVMKPAIQKVICWLAVALLAGGFPFRGEAKSYSSGGGHSFSSGGSHSFSSGGSHSSSSGGGRSSSGGSTHSSSSSSGKSYSSGSTSSDTGRTVTLPPRATALVRAILFPLAPAVTIVFGKAEPRAAPDQMRAALLSLLTPQPRARAGRKPAR